VKLRALFIVAVAVAIAVAVVVVVDATLLLLPILYYVPLLLPVCMKFVQTQRASPLHEKSRMLHTHTHTHTHTTWTPYKAMAGSIRGNSRA